MKPAAATLSILLCALAGNATAESGTGLDGTSGHVFKVNLSARSFELLKETEYDPKTDLGRSRFTVCWNDDTTITRIEEKKSFAGIKGPVIADFHGIDEANAKAMPVADYQTNLEKEIAILMKTGAQLIWCSTTPVPNSNKGKYARRKGAAELFNKAALEVMSRHPEILVNDLHAMISGSPVFDNWRKGVDVHFYTEPEQQALGNAVADAVRKAIEKK